MKKIIRVEVGGYEVSFLLETNKKIKLISYSCPKNYGDPFLPKYIYKKAIQAIKKMKNSQKNKK